MTSDKCKVVETLIILVDKESFANSSPPIYYYKFRAIGLHYSFEFLTFSLSTNKFIHYAISFDVHKDSDFVAIKGKNVVIFYPNLIQKHRFG